MHLWQRSKSVGSIIKATFLHWSDHDPFRNAVVISYYTIFSLPGLLVIIIDLAGYFFGEDAVANNISTQIQGMVGGDTAAQVESMIANANTTEGEGTSFSSILGVATLIFGATGAFYQLQLVLNRMWDVKPAPVKTKRKILKLLKDRLFSFGLILTVGFLLLVSLALSAMLSALSTWVATHLSEGLMVLFRLLDIVVSLSVVTALFAAIFKALPDAEVRWKDVWIGAFVTALLFVVAKFGLGLYFGSSNPASAYGAAGSIILIMLWTTYAGLILLLGAAFTRVYANRHGEKIQPAEFAVSTEGEEESSTEGEEEANTEEDQPGKNA